MAARRSSRSRSTRSRTTRSRPAKKAGFVKVEYGWPGKNGLKGGIIPVGTTHLEALRMMEIEVSPTKEGLISKLNGESIKYDDIVSEGTFMICPGVDSSSQLN